MIDLTNYWYFLKNKERELKMGLHQTLVESMNECEKKLESDFKKVAIINKNGIEDNILIRHKEITFMVEGSLMIVGKLQVRYVYKDGQIRKFSDDYNLASIRYADVDYILNGITYEKLSSLLNAIRARYDTVYDNNKKVDYVRKFYDTFYKKYFLDYMHAFMLSDYPSLRFIIYSDAYAVEFSDKLTNKLPEPLTIFDMTYINNEYNFSEMTNPEQMENFRIAFCDKNEDMRNDRIEIDNMVDEEFANRGDDFNKKSEFEKSLLINTAKFEDYNKYLDELIKETEARHEHETLDDTDEIDSTIMTNTVYDKTLEEEYKNIK